MEGPHLPSGASDSGTSTTVDQHRPRTLPPAHPVSDTSLKLVAPAPHLVDLPEVVFAPVLHETPRVRPLHAPVARHAHASAPPAPARPPFAGSLLSRGELLAAQLASQPLSHSPRDAQLLAGPFEAAAAEVANWPWNSRRGSATVAMAMEDALLLVRVPISTIRILPRLFKSFFSLGALFLRSHYPSLHLPFSSFAPPFSRAGPWQPARHRRHAGVPRCAGHGLGLVARLHPGPDGHRRYAAVAALVANHVCQCLYLAFGVCFLSEHCCPHTRQRFLKAAVHTFGFHSCPLFFCCCCFACSSVFIFADKTSLSCSVMMSRLHQLRFSSVEQYREV